MHVYHFLFCYLQAVYCASVKAVTADRAVRAIRRKTATKSTSKVDTWKTRSTTFFQLDAEVFATRNLLTVT